MNPIQAWSSGGGSQSNLIAALICAGQLPKPDVAAIIDVGQEMASTWQYYETYTKPALAAVGVDLIRIQKEKYATVDLFSTNGKTFLMPVFTDFTGEASKLPTNCSNEWKQRVFQRYLREQFPAAKKFNIWLGMAFDEPKRIKQNIGKYENYYPLVKLGIRKHQCNRIIEKLMGWPPSPKSTCWNCPNKSPADWLKQKAYFPDDFERACVFDEWMRAEVDDTFYLHPTCKPLREISEKDEVPDLFTERCDSGFCFV